MMSRRALFLSFLISFSIPLIHAAAPSSNITPDDFVGIWVGEITAPNARTEIGLAFIRTEKGLLVSLNLPEMFLYSVNFGPAKIDGDTFQLEPLNLVVTHQGDTLTGTFAIAKLPVTLRRGGSFSKEPPSPTLPPAPAATWTRALGATAWASPVAQDGVVYVGTIDGKFHAVRATDGNELWTWSGPNPCYGAALASADSIIFVDDRCDLVALNRLDGTLKWRTALHDEKLAGGPPPKNETFNHRAAAPVVDPKGVLYIGSTDGGLYAVRAKTGKILWRHETKAKFYAAVALDNERVIGACYDGSVFVFDLRTRQEISRVKLGGALVSTPVVVGDRIVVGSRDYLLYGLDLKSRAVVWRDSYWFSWVESTPRLADGLLYIGGSDYRRVSALEPSTGKARWATDVRGLSWGTPVVSAQTVFAATSGQIIAGTVIKHTGGIVALDRVTGAIKWRYLAPTDAGADFNGYVGSLVLADAKIIGAGVDGTLIAFPAE